MAGINWMLAAIVCIIGQSTAWEFSSSTELEALTNANKAVLVAFVLPSEEKSLAIETQWNAAATASDVPFFSIDCSVEVSACEAYQPLALPTIKLVQDTTVLATYGGPIRASAIAGWTARALRPPVTTVQLESLDIFRTIDEVVFLLDISSDDEASQSTFEAVAHKYNQEFTFGINIVTTRDENKGPILPTVSCFRNIDEDQKVLNGAFDRENLESFVIEASRPIIGELLPQNHQRFLNRGWPMVYVFAATEPERAELRESLKKLARSYHESLTMVTVDPLEFPDLPAKLGLESGHFPAGAVHQLSKDLIFPYPKGLPITPSSMQKWGLDVWQGRVKPWYPPGSTPVPTPEAPNQIKSSRKVSIRSFPGMKINIGRDEL